MIADNANKPRKVTSLHFLFQSLRFSYQPKRVQIDNEDSDDEDQQTASQNDHTTSQRTRRDDHDVRSFIPSSRKKWNVFSS